MRIESPVLRRLGPVPFWRGSTKCLTGLDRVYRRAMTAAAQLLGRLPPQRQAGQGRAGVKGGKN